MNWRVNGKLYDISRYSNEVRTKLFSRWREEGTIIECLCQKSNNQYPQMHIRKTSGNLYIPVNNRTNSKENIQHAPDCSYNTNYRQFLGARGIKVTDEGIIECVLKDKKHENKNTQNPASSKLTSNSFAGTSSSPLTALRFLFLTIIQKYEIHSYKKDQERNIDKRLYKACCEAIVNKVPLNSVLYLTNNRFKYSFSKHQFIVGWGRKDQFKKIGKFVSIPLFALTNPSEFVYEHKVPEWIFEKATLTSAAVSTGYWVIWRDKDNKGVLREKEIIFVPAEGNTMIPVDSSLEEKMLKYLVSNGISFKKPQIMSVGDDLLPDFVLSNQDTTTIIEVAGLLEKQEYLTKLMKKKEYYIDMGFKYIEWDGKAALDSLPISKGN